jgi:type IV pilus assembly protein PilB
VGAHTREEADVIARGRRTKRFVGSHKRIGEILLDRGRISEDQLQEALELQKRDPRKLGEILIDLGYIGKRDVAEAFAELRGLEYVEFTEQDVDPAAVVLVNQRLLRKHKVLPLRLEEDRLVVAMANPNDFFAVEDLTLSSGYPVVPVVALEEEIQRVSNKLFAMGEGVTELLESAAGESAAEESGEVELGADTGSDEKPSVRLVDSILQRAVADGASDIHVEPRNRQLVVRMRVDGVLREVMNIPPRLRGEIVARLKILAELDIAERRLPQDGRFSVRLGSQKIDLRAATLPTVFGEKVVLRLLDTSNAEADLGQLGFAPQVLRRYEGVFRKPYGTVLVTGPTGSGKSTTLYATLKELNSPERNIITVEDPVEFRMEGVNQVQVNLKAGLSFASGLRSILRSDPDVVMIGEIRDRETAKISVEAALTGHLVLATLHTNNAPAAITRLTDMGVEPFLTASAVDCVIAQRLARRLCERCKQPADLEPEILTTLDFPRERFPEVAPNFYRAVGCQRCGWTGYRGRVGIYEMMILSDEVRALVLERAPTGEIGRVAERDGMVRLREDGLLKAAAGVTTIEEVLRTVT